MPATASLDRYHRKRDFGTTAEPRGKRLKAKGFRYLIQKHDARRLHYDLRLELDGVLKSWAVTRGPSLDPKERRLAVHVEDHPVDYGSFEGTIPQGQYGGGTVMLWDTGTWEPLGDPHAMYRKGHLKFAIQGDRLHGEWHLVRMHKPDEKRDNWLLIKSDDAFARPGDVDALLEENAVSIKTGRDMEAIAEGAKAVPKPKASAKRKAGQKTRQKNPRNATPLPDFVPPQLATRVDAAPDGADWLHEIKLDGYRIQARRQDGEARMLTRTGLDWTSKFGKIAAALAKLRIDDALVDGEIVVFDADGSTSFAKLQQALSEGEDESDGDDAELVYVAFDLLHLDGEDLRTLPLTERKARLRKLVPLRSALLRYSDHHAGQGGRLLAQACSHKLEGIVSKRADAPYVSGRSAGWVKSKCRERQEFVIGGFTEPTEQERGVGSLLLGYREDGALRYAGRVGTGFGRQNGPPLRRKLDTILAKTPAFASIPAAARRGAIFVAPKLVAEVEFATWTADRLVRQAAFLGLRADKPPTSIAREKPMPVAKAKKPAAKASAAGIAITHPERVLFPEQGITKQQLADYYIAIADRILPHVADRPLPSLRCPEGISGDCFFQKHLMRGMPDVVTPLKVKGSEGVSDYLSIHDAAGLAALVQFGVIELHPWGCKQGEMELADRMVFDLDPDEKLAWGEVVRAAKEVRDRLTEVGLKSFLKTTGGKGLHVVVPLNPAVDWAVVKAFSHALASAMAAAAPDRFIAKVSKAARRGKIFIDYLRNQRGATSVAPYAVRARPGAAVSMPVPWSALTDKLRPDQFKIADAVRKRADPWKDFFATRQTIDRKVVDLLTGNAGRKSTKTK
jgi:bifunctional non-homologous end joining protein LigD